MKIRFHKGDLTDLKCYEQYDLVAVDTESMGLNPNRDRLCLVQLSPGDGSVDLVQIHKDQTESPNLCALLTDPAKTKIFHYARFDIAILQKYLNILPSPLWCTKIASRLVRTNTDQHGLKDLVKEFIDIDLPKEMQSSDWGADNLTQTQMEYAANDVLYLHQLQKELSIRLDRENRLDLARECFEFLPIRAKLDLFGWSAVDIFSHH